ncbi:MAG: HD domain-containing protein, partial [Acidaminococcaceae bacterium]|nr:HD domain-containing protein [Acidaminococcaceae bacterium]
SGTETELLLKVMGIRNKNSMQRVTAEEFRQFFDKVRKLNLPQLLKTYHLTETEAELVLPMVLLYEQLLDLAPAAKEIIITKDTFLDGMILRWIIREKDENYTRMLEEEQMSLVHHVGEDYEYDYNHVTQVEKLALVIFDKIGKKYGLDEHCRLLLRAAAILHDIGKYVSMRSHSLYSYQLIMGTDLLGFTEEDKLIVAMASYYHAHNVMERDDKRVPELKSSLVPVVAKLSAIIRLADALDRSYMQKIQRCKVNLHNRELTIQVVSKGDLDLEEWTFASKVLMMEEVYGFKVKLERVESL